MNLYLVSQEQNDDWDTYDSFVVCAPDELTARQTHPSSGFPNKEWQKQFSSWCSGPEFVKVQLIGVADVLTPAGVICASFNAG